MTTLPHRLAAVAVALGVAWSAREVLACCGTPCDNSVDALPLIVTPPDFNPDWGELATITFTISANNGQTISYSIACDGVTVCTGGGFSTVSGSCFWNGSGRPPGQYQCTLTATTSGGLRPECGSATDTESADVFLVPLRVESISFNYEPSWTMSSPDAITVRKLNAIVTAPEWTVSGANKPAAYAISNFRPPTTSPAVNPLMKVVFKVSRPGTYDIQPGRTGTLPSPLPKTITFTNPGLSPEHQFELNKDSFPAGLGILSGYFTWQVSGGPTFIPLSPMRNTGAHKLYVTLAPGRIPMQEPWVEVLDWSCSWGSGLSDPVAIGAAIANPYHNSLGLEYDPSQQWFGSQMNFNLTEFLSYLNAPTGHRVDCNDTAHFQVGFSTAVGIKMAKVHVAAQATGTELGCPAFHEIYVKHNYIDGVGPTPPKNDWTCSNKAWDATKRGGFAHHAVAVISSHANFPADFNATDPTYDASNRYDAEAEPQDAVDSATHTWVLPAGQVTFGDKLTGAGGWLGLFTDDTPNPSAPYFSQGAPFSVH